MNTITINFGNVVNELKDNNWELCYIGNTICLKDENSNIYSIENYYHGGYFDKFIKNKTLVKFNKRDINISELFIKKIWDYKYIEDFIKRQCK